MKLTSVKMQLVIIDGNYFEEMYMPLLRFGKGKSKEFKMNLYIKEGNKDKIKQCFDELNSFVGKGIEEIRENVYAIEEKYNEWKPTKKTTNEV